MSHEIRTPLNAIIGLNSLLLSSPLSAEQQQQLELSRQAGETLLQLINDFLDFTKVDSGYLQLEERPFSPRQVLDEALALVRDSSERKGVVLESDLQPPPRLEGDPARLRQIVLNLLSNALKFTPAGRIALRCREIPGPAPQATQEAWLRVEVEDTGIGISEEQLKLLFQPFTQADPSTTRLYGGTGLGLAICSKLSHLMGGRIGVRSHPGQGSLFWVELPFGDLPAQAADHEPPGPPAAAPAPYAPGECHVLLVEDNATNQLMTQTMLKRMGCTVDVAANGLEAISECQRRPYNIVLMDCDMPLMDGYGATRAIRAQPNPNQHTPIVALTAAAFIGDRENCLAAGMNDHLAKPIRLRELDRTVRRWVPSPAAQVPT